MKQTISVNDLSSVSETLSLALAKATHPQSVRYADVRLQVSEGIGSYSEDGTPKMTSMDWSASLGVRVIAGTQLTAAGYYGTQLGLMDFKRLDRVLNKALSTASERARANTLGKTRFVKRSGIIGNSVQSTELVPIPVMKAVVRAEFSIDPRSIDAKRITDFTCSAAQAAKAFHPDVKRVELVVNSDVSRQIFASSEGAYIDQSTCSSGGTVFVVAQNGKGGSPADLYHHTGNQLGFEAVSEGKNAHNKDLQAFSVQIADEAVKLANAKPAPKEDRPVVVVIDPDLVALFAHEIIGHPSELDRAIKMEAGYAGRSWFFQDLTHTMVGKRVGSPLLTAFSDPTLRGGYGYYLYDDEGTPARRVTHIQNGIYRDFMNSRQTAHVAQVKPNGHYKANDASVVPLIRMSVSAIAPGKSDPAKMISEVKRGYYCVGHRIPSISESRENFQIAPRLIYEIRNGELGQIYRDGRVTADSRDFFLSIDAVGNDFTVFPIPNCGKGQPMQAKQVGNGGPSVRGMARIAQGEYR